MFHGFGVRGPEVEQLASEKLPSQERIVFQLPFFRGELLNFRGVYPGSKKTISFGRGGWKKHQTNPNKNHWADKGLPCKSKSTILKMVT